MSAAVREDIKKGLRQTWGGLLFAISLVVLLCLLTYNWGDVSVLKSPPNEFIHNCFGPAGAWLSFVLFWTFGVAAYLVPVWCFVFGCLLVFAPEQRHWPRVMWMIVFMSALAVLLDLQSNFWRSWTKAMNIEPNSGGMVSRQLVRHLFVPMIEESGTAIIAWVALVMSGIQVVGISTAIALSRRLKNRTQLLHEQYVEWSNSGRDRTELIEQQTREIEKKRSRLEETVRREERMSQLQAKIQEREKEKEKARKEAQEKAKAREQERERVKAQEKALPPKPVQPVPAVVERTQLPVQSGQAAAAAPETRRPYELPPITLLNEIPPAKEKVLKGDVETTGRIIQETLAEFGIQTEVANVEQGPAVTRYELLPAAGVKVERIAALSNNLALALKSTSVLVQAPVPGKGVVGIEVPNAISSMVYLREMLEGETWHSTTAALPLALGKDVSGEDVIADLAGMPHLLIAGATGSGKTICMHSALLGLLMKHTPDHLRLMLVDPKIVEFSAYDKIPHLIAPVIIDPRKVVFGLRWAITEMEKRYKLFARAGVRNIDGYNNRPGIPPGPAKTATEAEPLNEIPAKMPYLVIAVDELADLMLVAQADIENCIARLAQLSRAVGIHMILATQRPSVNIITGTIKANFPARIAFQVAQRVDSRTILDANGADNLLGKGDMLFLPAGSNKMVRAQGSYVSDHETKKVMDFIRQQAEPMYQLAIHEKAASGGGSEGGSSDDGVDDELLEQSVQIIKETRRASTSSLQRRLRIGYTRAARIMDILEERGIVGPPRGSDPREILIDLDGEMEEGLVTPAEEEVSEENVK